MIFLTASSTSVSASPPLSTESKPSQLPASLTHDTYVAYDEGWMLVTDFRHARFAPILDIKRGQVILGFYADAIEGDWHFAIQVMKGDRA